MTQPITLDKQNPLLPAEDYVALRKEGFKEIEKSGHDHWTEYNNSDPGITILEAVSYAITDLAYRTGFEMKDLLAPEHLTGDIWKEIFYTARQIFHNSPLTLNDYRKLIIDVKGVRNAWIEPSKNYEVPLWINYNHYHSGTESDCGCGGDGAAVSCYGKLTLNPVGQDQVKDEAIENVKREVEVTENKVEELRRALDELLESSGEQPSEKEIQRKERIQKKITKLNRTLDALRIELGRIEGWTFIPSKIVELEGLYNVMVEYEEDVLTNNQREEVRSRVVDKLLSNRNLCEDFLSINAVEYEDFGIAGSIALEEDADPDQVFAHILFTIYKYFSPSVPFYTIEQMLEKGYAIDEIFDGPPLKHGFIETSELEKTDLYRDIRLSDIINEVADIQGIRAVTFLRLPFSGFDNDEDGGYFNRWITFLRQERKLARIQLALSTMMLCKEREFITYNLRTGKDRSTMRTEKLFNDLKAIDRAYKLEGAARDLPVPAGENMDLEDYFPVTYSLPMCYGVSDRAALPADASEKRKVQALQLKGYLLFFEQLLADYLVQLNHVRDLFSFDSSVKKTYFTRVLTEIDDLQKLVIDRQDKGEAYWEEIVKDFGYVLQHLVETPRIFNKRRNKFLDHMLARFAEDLTDYENITKALFPYKADERLIQDKTRILSKGEYYRMSTARGEGFNYARTECWNSGNVSGTERRVGRLLGFNTIDRRSLTPASVIVEPVFENDSKKKHHGQLPKKDRNGKPLNVIKIVDVETKEVLLTSVEVTEGCCTDELINEILKYADERQYFRFQDDLKSYARKSAGNIGTFSWELWDSTNAEEAVVLAYGPKFDTRKAREAAFKKLQAVLDQLNENEGFHLVEHILLRPKLDEVLDEANKRTEVRLLDVCLDSCDLGKGLHEGEIPNYRKKVSRIPARKCYDKMPWILEYFRLQPPTPSLLVQQSFPEESKNVPLKFRRYEMLAQRVQDLHNFGSERVNYEIVSNLADDPAQLRYGFIIYGKEKTVLAQSLFMFVKRTRQQEEEGTVVENDIESAIAEMIRYFGFELDLYCDPDPCDHNEDPYSFRATAVFPCWTKRFRDPTFRTLVERTLQTQSPAHVHIKVMWIGLRDMMHFEEAYYNWVREMSQTEMPSYEFVNPLVEVLDTLKECGCCEDDCSCGDHDGPRESRSPK